MLDALLAERSVSRAGARVGLSQPAVSNALAQLRAHFEDPLLVRKAGGMAPTERALALAGPLRAALLALEQGLEPSAAFDPAAAARDFTIMTNDFVAFAMLPRLLARLQHEAPGVRLQVRAWQEHVVPSELARGDADLVLGLQPRAAGRAPRDAAVPGSLRLRRAQGTPESCAARSRSRPTRSWRTCWCRTSRTRRGVVDDVLAQRGLTRNVALRVSHFLLVPPILAATDYVAALSQLVAAAGREA